MTEDIDTPETDTTSHSLESTDEAEVEPQRAPEATSNLIALVRLLVVLAAIVGVFVAFGLGALLVVIVAIIVMVMVHELGHFLTAKWSHMKVTEYFVGFGPRLFSVQRGETAYGIKPILAGGYVKIIGMTSLEDVDPADEPRTYRQQPFHKRIIVASAGSFMHFVMAFLLAYSVILYFGVPSTNGVEVGGFVHWAGHTLNAAQRGGLHAGDEIVAVNGRSITNPSQLTTAINDSPGRPVTLTVQRGGRRVNLSVTPDVGHALSNGTEVLGPYSGSGKPVGLIGITTAPVRTSEGPVRAVGTAVIDIGRVTAATVAGLGHLFSLHGLSSLYSQVTSARAATKASNNGTRIESIVGAVRTATQAEQAGMINLIEVLIALNIVIGIVNMIPMLPLDGGHVAVAVYERVRTRKGRPYYRADTAKLMPVVYAFVAVLLVIVASAVFLDIAHPMANPFR
ncbi:MAG: M50 family metallopeptidase [Acidimicrobiales bacterium]